MATDFIGAADAETLGHEVEMFGMKMTVATAFEVFVIEHANSIGGEISALKSVAGLKGFPFSEVIACCAKPDGYRSSVPNHRQCQTLAVASTKW